MSASSSFRQKSSSRAPWPGHHRPSSCTATRQSQACSSHVSSSRPVGKTRRIGIPDEVRTAVVLSGTLYFGSGDKWDESKFKAYPAGTFYSEPSKAPHFTWAKDGEVIIQVTKSFRQARHSFQTLNNCQGNADAQPASASCRACASFIASTELGDRWPCQTDFAGSLGNSLASSFTSSLRVPSDFWSSFRPWPRLSSLVIATGAHECCFRMLAGLACRIPCVSCICRT